MGCPAVTLVWVEAGLWQSVDRLAGEVDSFRELIFKLLKDSPSHTSDQILVLLWRIWSRRNDILWNVGPMDPTSIVRRASQISMEWTVSRRTSIADQLQSPQPSPSSWIAPRQGFFKCNTDAATFAYSSSAGFGAIIRDCRGTFIAASATPFTSLPPVRECEARALINAMRWVGSRGLTHVVFETDAKVVADAIYDTSRDYSEFGDIIEDIRNLLLTHGNFSIHAVGRQANEAAHALARHSRFLSCPTFYHVIPSFLIPCINDNSRLLSSNEMNVPLSSDGPTEAR